VLEVIVQFLLHLRAYGIYICTPLLDLLQGLDFPGKASLRRLGQDVPLQFLGNRRLQKTLVPILDPSYDMKELDEIFAGELSGLLRGGSLRYEMEFFEWGSFFERLIDESLKVAVVTLEVPGRFGDSSGRISIGKRHNHASYKKYH
jgi:hypothetical protein